MTSDVHQLCIIASFQLLHQIRFRFNKFAHQHHQYTQLETDRLQLWLCQSWKHQSLILLEAIPRPLQAPDVRWFEDVTKWNQGEILKHLQRGLGFLLAIAFWKQILPRSLWLWSVSQMNNWFGVMFCWSWLKLEDLKLDKMALLDCLIFLFELRRENITESESCSSYFVDVSWRNAFQSCFDLFASFEASEAAARSLLDGRMRFAFREITRFNMTFSPSDSNW